MNGTGNYSRANVITGNGQQHPVGAALNDTLNGGAGNDILNGGPGPTAWTAGGQRRLHRRQRGRRRDRDRRRHRPCRRSVTHTLAGNIENLTLTGAANINGTGNATDNMIIGNNGNNVVSGLAGNNALNGGGFGNDTLNGGAVPTT